MSSIYLAMSAWREILARTLDHFEGQDNVSPDWLINPATRRRLKLDRYYPDAGIAVRFVGLTAKGQKRQSDWEVLEAQQRDQTRDELCRRHGVELAIIDPVDDPVKQMDSFLRTLSRARKAAPAKKLTRSHRRLLDTAFSQASDLRSRIARNPERMMATLAESWRDRESGLATELQQAGADTFADAPGAALGSASVAAYESGQRVRHARFGEGVITEVNGSGADATISIRFQGEDARTFLASLVQDKLAPLD
jgi:hypothetical protein